MISMRDSEYNFEKVGNYNTHDDHDLTKNSLWASKIDRSQFVNEEWGYGHIVADNYALYDSKGK